MSSAITEDHRSGFAGIVGRPNVGKSTLTNALVGQKVAITSGKPQTTRRVIRGILTRPDAQLILVDTPGVHRPRTLLGERLNALVEQAYSDVDVLCFCLPADELIGPGDRRLAGQLAAQSGGRIPLVAIVTKTDKVAHAALPDKLQTVAALAVETGFTWADVVPVSATSGSQLTELADVLISHLPAGPVLFPDGEATDEPLEITIAELIREAALEGVSDELPHSIAVIVEEMGERPDRPADRPLIDIHANVFVERQSQKAIVIGAKGARMRQVGTQARREIEALLGKPVFLDLHVKVAKEWQRDPKQLNRLGF